MPIVVDRRTGEIISKPEITQEQKNTVWERVIRNWIDMNPEKFQALLTENNAEEKD